MNAPIGIRPRLACLALTTALLAAGCGVDSESGSGAGPNPEAVLIYGVNQIESLDPIRVVSPCELTALKTVFDTLIFLDDDGLPIPGLATSWELDGDRFRMTLRDDVVFQDGTAFNAEAAKFNLDRVKNDPSSTLAGDLFQVKSVEVVDEFTIELVLDPVLAGSLPAILAGRAGMMASPTAIEAAGSSEKFSQEPVGTGMYEVEPGWSPRESLSVRAWDNYWDDDAQELGGIDFKLIEPDAILGALRAGDIDMAPVEASDAKTVKASGNLELLSRATNEIRMLIINETLDPWTDVRVRKALNYSIDRRALAEGLTDGYGEPAFGYFPKDHWAYDPDLVDKYPYDPERSKELLAEAGYDGPVKFRAHIGQGNTDYIRMGEAIADMLSKGGFEMELWFSGPGMSVPLLYRDGPNGTGSSEASPLASSPSNDPDILFRQRFLTGGASNAGGNEQAGMRELLDEGIASVELDERAETYRKAQELAVENALDSVPLWFVSAITARQKTIGGYTQARGACDENFRGVYKTVS